MQVNSKVVGLGAKRMQMAIKVDARVRCRKSRDKPSRWHLQIRDTRAKKLRRPHAMKASNCR